MSLGPILSEPSISKTDRSDQGTVQVFIGWFFLCIALTYANVMLVANIAHGAGFLFGMLYGSALFATRERRRWIAASLVATTAVLLSLVGCPGHRQFEEVKENHGLWWRPARIELRIETPPDAS